MIETDVTMLQGRMRELETNIKELEVKALEALYRVEAQKPVKAYVPLRRNAGPGCTRPPPARPCAPSPEVLREPEFMERIYQANEKHVSKGLPVGSGADDTGAAVRSK